MRSGQATGSFRRVSTAALPFLAVFFWAAFSGSEALASKKHRHHEAHQHGVAELSISFEATKGLISFRAPTESLWGFEHEARTKKEKARVAEVTSKLEREWPQMIQFDGKLNCAFSDIAGKAIKVKGHGKHQEFEMKSKVECLASPLGTILDLQLEGRFASLKSLKLTLVVDDLQKSMTLDKLNRSVPLSN